MRRAVAGFTLVELLTALALSGFVVLMVSRLLAVATSSARALDDARIALDQEQNGRRWLRGALASLDPNANPGGFAGQHDRVTFTGWLEAPGGWFRPRRLTIAADSGSLIAMVDSTGSVRLADSVVSLSLDYLLEPGATTTWVEQWISPISAPLAVRFRIARRVNGSASVDTLFLRIGERG